MFAVGIDLAWSPRNRSGLAVAERAGRTWRLLDVHDALGDNREILAHIEKHVGPEKAIIAIDAPLVVPYRTRGREGDRIVTRVFGPSEAGVYPATRKYMGRYGAKRIWDLVRDLERLGYRHDCRIYPETETRQFFETYPHAASVALFDLEKTLKYKVRQGRSYETRWAAFREYEKHIRGLRACDPAFEDVDMFLDPDVSRRKGKALKEYDDRLDAILCAYIAAYYWTWGTRCCAIFGTLGGGYIVTPMNGRLARRIPRDSPFVTYDGGTGGRISRG